MSIFNNENDSYNDNDDEQLEPNWELLSQTMSIDTLNALKVALDNKKQEIKENNIIYNNNNNKIKVAATNAHYNKQDYWEERFLDEDEYDWLGKLDKVENDILPLLKKADKILIIGCGNSTFSSDLYDKGYCNIINIDYSQVVIKKMRELHSKQRPEMKWEYMDMTKLTYDNESFDVVIDKAATDAIMVGEGDVWDPNTSLIELCDGFNSGISRVLKKETGLCIQISFAQPHFRSKYLMGSHVKDNNSDTYNNTSLYSPLIGKCNRYNWNLSYSVIGDAGSFDYYIYYMRKI
jgi:2-polyprenyl-3-methyl-5-hydroxy-6-metoxy-1,4-benzoquinol methylase